jgi:acetylglutamate kinase
VVDVRPEAVLDLIEAGRIPVVATVAPDETGQVHNVNADTAAAALAVALQAKALRFLTDVAGLLDAHGNVVARLHASEAEHYIDAVTGGMKPKLEAALHALRAGVAAIEIGENGGTHLVAA